MKEDQIKYYEDKLKYEMDPSDLFDAINRLVRHCVSNNCKV